MNGYVDMELPTPLVNEMRGAGLARIGDDGVHVLTDKGAKVVNDYCDRVLRERRDKWSA